MIEANICKYWIMKQVETKFGSLKIDRGGDTMMSFDAIYYHTTYNKLNKFFIVAQFFFKMPETLLGLTFH